MSSARSLNAKNPVDLPSGESMSDRQADTLCTSGRLRIERDLGFMTNIFIITVLIGYLLVGTGLMMTLRGLHGVMATLVIGWFFLPPARGIDLPGLPAFTKEYAVSYAVLLGAMLIESERITSFRLKLIDIPMLVWMFSPLPASVTNGLGAYDGISEVYSQIIVYGIPYYMGRVYIKTPEDVKTVAKWFVIAGLIAVPFVVWEARMSPHLNRSIYGYEVAKFHMAKRLGGYRPMLFMRHGLEVGLWMATCSAVGLWLWITSARQFRILGVSIHWLAAAVLIATVISRSLGALILLSGTTAAAVFVRTTGLKIVLIVMVLTPPVYLSVRLSNIWSPDQLTAVIRAFDDSRADSLEARLTQELVVSEHALEKPVFGWGGHNRYRPLGNDDQTDPVDGWTTITLGKYGLVGLCSLLGAVTLPSLILLLRIKKSELTSVLWAPAVGILLGISIFSMDILFNAFPAPLHFIGVGVLTSVAVCMPKWQRIIRHHRLQASASGPSKANGAPPPEAH